MEHVIERADQRCGARTERVARAIRCSKATRSPFRARGSRRRRPSDRDENIDLDFIRPDLAAVLSAAQGALDAARPPAVARRRKTGQRTVRENVDDLLDPGSFVEYGSLVVAARRKRHSLEKLIEQTPADGMVMGLGPRQRRALRRRGRALRRDGLRLHGAGRHAGRLQPSQDGPADRARRTLALADGFLLRGRRRPSRRHRRRRLCAAASNCGPACRRSRP